MNRRDTLTVNEVPHDTYGEATPAIVRIVALAESLNWFSRGGDRSPNQAQSLINDHLALIDRHRESKQFAQMTSEFPDGTLIVAAQIYRRLNMIDYQCQRSLGGQNLTIADTYEVGVCSGRVPFGSNGGGEAYCYDTRGTQKRVILEGPPEN